MLARHCRSCLRTCTSARSKSRRAPRRGAATADRAARALSPPQSRQHASSAQPHAGLSMPTGCQLHIASSTTVRRMQHTCTHRSTLTGPRRWGRASPSSGACGPRTCRRAPAAADPRTWRRRCAECGAKGCCAAARAGHAWSAGSACGAQWPPLCSPLRLAKLAKELKVVLPGVQRSPLGATVGSAACCCPARCATVMQVLPATHMCMPHAAGHAVITHMTHRHPPSCSLLLREGEQRAL